jgi:hypothetical protein
MTSDADTAVSSRIYRREVSMRADRLELLTALNEVAG